MDEITVIMGLCFGGPITWLFYRTISNFLEQRSNRVYRWIGGVFGFCVSNMVIFPRDVFNITISIFLLFAMLISAFKGKLLVYVSVVLLFFPIVISLNFLTMEIEHWIWDSFTSRSDAADVFLWGIMLTLMVLFWFLFYKLSDKKYRETVRTLDTKSWFLLDAICLASLAAVISCVYYTPAQTYKVWPCMLACMITNIFAVRLVLYLAENVRGRLMQKNMKLQQDYYRELEANQLEIRKIRHDMNNHLSVVSELLKEGKDGEAKAYFEKLSGQLRAKSRTFCKDSIVNAVLNSKYNRAVEQGIDCFFHIELDSLIFIDSLDICTIFSNTLDNAIEACMKVEKNMRSISVKARCVGNQYFSYEIVNTKNQKTEEKNGKYTTWKKNEKSHGIGIENVKEVVKHYQGTMDITYDDKTFSVVILIAEGSRLD